MNMTKFTINESANKSLNVGEKTKSPCILIATPMFGGMCTGHFTMATINAMNELRKQRIECHLASLMNESLITRARNELARMFLDDDKFTHLMFIDADIYFEEDSISRLYSYDEDIVCGLYPKKEIEWDRVKKASDAGMNNLNEYSCNFVINLPDGVTKIKQDSRGLIEVRHAGTGFMMVKRKVFEDLSSSVAIYRSSTLKDQNDKYIKPLVKQFFDTSIDYTGALLSEDYHFCELWRKKGGKIFVDPDIHLKHIGTHVFEGRIV